MTNLSAKPAGGPPLATPQRATTIPATESGLSGDRRGSLFG